MLFISYYLDFLTKYKLLQPLKHSRTCVLIQRAHDLNAFSLQEDVPNTIGLFFHPYYVKPSYQHCLTKKVDSVVKTNKLTSNICFVTSSLSTKLFHFRCLYKVKQILNVVKNRVIGRKNKTKQNEIY